MTKNSKVIGLTLALCMPVAAFAADVASMDADGDGAVTMSEFQTAMPDAEAGTFSAVDTNADGVLTEDEVAAATEAGALPEG